MGVRRTRGLRPEARPSMPLCTTRVGIPRHSWTLPRRVWKWHYCKNVGYVLSTSRKLDRRTIPRRSSAFSSVVPLKEFVPQNRDGSSVSRFRLLMCLGGPSPLLARVVISRPRDHTSTSPPNLIDEPLESQCAMGTDPSWIYPATNGPRRISSTASMD